MEVADRFKTLPDGAEKTALSMELFGRAGKDMIPVLNLGGQGIKDLQDKADKLGLTLSNNTLAQMARFITSQKDLNDSTTSLKLAIGETTAPILTEFNNKLSGVVTTLLNGSPAVRDITAGFLAFGGPVISGAGALIAFAANLTTVITGARAAMAAIAALQLTAALGISLPVAGAIAGLGLLIGITIQAKDEFHRLKSAIDDVNATPVNIGGSRVSGSSGTAWVSKLRDAFQFRAAGGPVSSGTPYVVGEKGPEIFQPTNSGTIIPNNQLGSGGGSVTNNITIQAGAFMGNDVDARKFAQKVLNSMQEIAGSKNMSLGQMIG